MSVQELQKYTYFSKYARYNKEAKRRETWGEAVDRMKHMHLRKYPQVAKEIEWAFQFVQEQKVLGSQRALQFGGEPIERVHERIYNCCSAYCDRLRFFQECFFLLLAGSGTGFSIQWHHVNKLPKFSLRKTRKTGAIKKYIVPDSIQGWADSLGVLLSNYFENPIFPEYYDCDDVDIDTSEIRPEGSIISSGTGKAPGPKPLIRALNNIKNLLDRCLANGQERLRPIDAYDIVMHSSDAVLSGGIRRSSSISIFSPDDEDMLTAKTGNWFYDNPQRARSNNSVMLVRNQVAREQFLKIIESVRQFGEPGFILCDSTEGVYNPCFHGSTRILTDNGYVKIKDLYELNKELSVGVDLRAGKDSEIDLSAADVVLKPASRVCLTMKDASIYEIITEHGHSIKATEYHTFPTLSGRKKLSELVEGDELLIQSREGFFGKDGDYNTGYELGFSYDNDDEVPAEIWTSCKQFVLGYINGLAGNGSFYDNKSKFKLKNTKSQLFLVELQILLNNLGIVSEIKPNNISICGENYHRFCKKIHNKTHLACHVDCDEEVFTTAIKSISYFGRDDVYCLNQPETHTVIANGIVSGNCSEIQMYPVDVETNQSGWQMCNLSTINGKLVRSREEFLLAATAASIIGTLQAGYTDFPYLGEVSERIVRREALLGVSITGIMDTPEVLLNPDFQRQAAEVVSFVNREIAEKIGIKPAARTTTVKPEGTSSCLLGCASGIHPHHARRYLRRVQANKLEVPYQIFNRINSVATETSVWSANKTDAVLSFCCEVGENAIVKSDLTAVEFLEKVKLTQNNWVKYGKVAEHCTQPWLSHNVSNTITVHDHEWEEVGNYLFDNREYFAAVSLLPATGDKDYPQAPFTAVLTEEELINLYTKKTLGVAKIHVKNALIFFNKNLWFACDIALGVNALPEPQLGDDQEENENIMFHYNKQVKWVNQVKKLARDFFNDDVRKATYCLKDIYNLDLWNKIMRKYKPVDYTKVKEEEDNTKLVENVACAGGACELV